MRNSPFLNLIIVWWWLRTKTWLLEQLMFGWELVELNRMHKTAKVQWMNIHVIILIINSLLLNLVWWLVRCCGRDDTKGHGSQVWIMPGWLYRPPSPVCANYTLFTIIRKLPPVQPLCPPPLSLAASALCPGLLGLGSLKLLISTIHTKYQVGHLQWLNLQHFC